MRSFMFVYDYTCAAAGVRGTGNTFVKVEEKIDVTYILVLQSMLAERLCREHGWVSPTVIITNFIELEVG